MTYRADCVGAVVAAVAAHDPTQSQVCKLGHHTQWRHSTAAQQHVARVLHQQQ